MIRQETAKHDKNAEKSQHKRDDCYHLYPQDGFELRTRNERSVWHGRATRPSR